MSHVAAPLRCYTHSENIQTKDTTGNLELYLLHSHRQRSRFELKTKSIMCSYALVCTHSIPYTVRQLLSLRHYGSKRIQSRNGQMLKIARHSSRYTYRCLSMQRAPNESGCTYLPCGKQVASSLQNLEPWVVQQFRGQGLLITG